MGSTSSITIKNGFLHFQEDVVSPQRRSSEPDLKKSYLTDILPSEVPYSTLFSDRELASPKESGIDICMECRPDNEDRPRQTPKKIRSMRSKVLRIIIIIQELHR